jgi:L-sorbose 1-phosphate reductase
VTKYQSFVKANNPIPEQQFTWPLYGTGVKFLGKDGKPVERAVPEYSGDELLMRVDAVSMCYTDVKGITQGQNHPRLTGRNLMKDPIIPGHELSMTVVGVGKNLSDDYKVGDRYTLQPDVWVDGKNIQFCFEMYGGYRQYAKIGKEILYGDAGNYLIPITADMLYAAAAITEPWACVEAAYRSEYRDHLKDGGDLWIIGCDKSRESYAPDVLFERSDPASIAITNLPADLKEKISAICNKKSIPISEKALEATLEADASYDDIVVLDCNADTITRVSQKLDKGGLIVMFGRSDSSMIEIDLGRLHYDGIYYAGTDSLNLNKGYMKTAPRVNLVPGGKTWVVGAGGPMGRMHLQRAIEAKNGPALIVASEVTTDRFEALKKFFYPMALEYKKELIVVNPKNEPKKYTAIMQRVMDEGGFDDIEIMVAIVQVITETMKYPAKAGVINLFAGLKRGVTMNVDPWLIQGPQQVRFLGHSGSALDDQKAVVKKMLTGELKPELSVAAVGGLMQVADGIQAMKDWKYSGKIVIYPHVFDFPLTAMHEFEKKDPQIFAALGIGGTWTKEAEEKFLEKTLA